MALDRWIALVILVVSLAYGYAAFFTMDSALAALHAAQSDLAQRPFPKVLSILATITCALIVRPGVRDQSRGKVKEAPEIEYHRILTDYKVGQALSVAGTDGGLCPAAASGRLS